MANITHEELAETKALPLPVDANLEALIKTREEMCSTATRDFKLQSNQRFLRRVMSPDSPTRSLLMVHGTGVGKTCTAIQIAEEFIIRPEFQDKKVLVIANPSVEDNFKAQIFDITRVSVDEDGIVLSKQCTGRRYLDMLQRTQSEPLKYTDKASQVRITYLANKLIGEFYEFAGYTKFANAVERKSIEVTQNEFYKWIHETFDNRLIIVDEAHNLRAESSESETSKLVAFALETVLKVANGVTLVLLTATPMYDQPSEVLYYFQLFLWNDKRLSATQRLGDMFTPDLEFINGKEEEFRKLCQDYISYVRGENPFTFPFRLPPPDDMVAEPSNTDLFGAPIRNKRKYLTLTKSILSDEQAKAVSPLGVKATSQSELICMFPENKSFRETFQSSADGYSYKNEKFLAPSTLATYSSKFALITKLLKETEGVVFVYSNIVESGAQLFAMCLEEHGYSSAIGGNILKETSNEITRGSKGKYVLFTSNTTDAEIKKTLIRLKGSANANGSEIRVVIASPKVSEGVDFRFVRQIHILDPWFNMSRIEQVLGRGMRTCSHALLPFNEQNCTVYLHSCTYSDSSKETVDEYIYRTFVEEKAVKIAKVKRIIMESSMDCELQENLPPQWRTLEIPQTRNQDGENIKLTLSQMSAPTFEEGTYAITCNVEKAEKDPDHVRPLSAILDVKDEILDKLIKLFAKKPIWTKADLYANKNLKQYARPVLSYILQGAIDSGFQLKDKHGRLGYLQSKKNIFAFTIGEKDTMLDRLLKTDFGTVVPIPIEKPVEKIAERVAPTIDIEAKMSEITWPPYVAESIDPRVREWYVVDAILTPDEKIAHMLSIDWSNPPIYAAPLVVNEGPYNIYVLGPGKYYKDGGEKLEALVGADEDAYRGWIKNAKDKFVDLMKREDPALIFASMKDNGIIFNMDKKSTTAKRGETSKTIGGMACLSYLTSTLESLVELVAGRKAKELGVSGKAGLSLCLNLFFRQAILDRKEEVFWITPEEYALFNDDANRGELLARLKG